PPGVPNSVAVQGTHLYVGAGAAGLRVMDVSDPLQPVEVGALPTEESSVLDIALGGGYAYLAHANEGLKIVDIGDPANPMLVGSLRLVGIAYNVAVQGTLAFVTTGAFGLRVVDVADPTAPREVGFFDTSTNAWRVDVAGERIYVADQGGGLYILDFDEAGVSPVVGGTSFGLTAGASISWTDGVVETGYLVQRFGLSDGSADVLGPLPADATLFDDDPTQLSGSMYCYWLLPLSEAGVLGTSDMMCGLPGTAGGTLVAPRFTVRLNESQTATISWDSPGDSVEGEPDAFVLIAIPLDDSETRVSLLEPEQTSVPDLTDGVPTCYTLISIRGAQTGQTEILCAIPGFAN
ncbi:MAG: hypothetical protein MUF70_11570, partial [Myxococcota bacterium]|nr:hypothetical protein [Myxococcota bacterium]